jgi:hypothetical protein
MALISKHRIIYITSLYVKESEEGRGRGMTKGSRSERYRIGTRKEGGR